MHRYRAGLLQREKVVSLLSFRAFRNEILLTSMNLKLVSRRQQRHSLDYLR
jgi:hypothetical protein